MLNAIRKNGVVLALFACASTGLVALTHYLTQDKIKQQEQAQLLSILNQVIPHEAHDNSLYSACTLVSDPALGTDDSQPVYLASLNGEHTALAIEAVAPDGYNGQIKLIIGINSDGSVSGTRILSHQETPGLGDKIDLRVTDWVLSFNGKRLTNSNSQDWAVRKDGGQFDQFTGATITPRAVVKAVKNALEYVNEHREEILSQPLNCGGSNE